MIVRCVPAMHCYVVNPVVMTLMRKKERMGKGKKRVEEAKKFIRQGERGERRGKVRMKEGREGENERRKGGRGKERLSPFKKILHTEFYHLNIIIGVYKWFKRLQRSAS